MYLNKKDHHPGGGVVIALARNHNGIALCPKPSTDPQDPLRWRKRVKINAMLAVSLSNFVANFAGAGFSVATPILETQFQKSTSEVNGLLTFNFLLLGLGNLIWVPLASKYGKRFVMLSSMAFLGLSFLWTAKATTFESLLAARCVSGFASAAGESIVPGVVSDIFFLHERASMMAIYVIFISSATAIGPLIASFMVGYLPGNWVDFTWLCMALAWFCFLCLFFYYPETNFIRAKEVDEQPISMGAVAVSDMAKHETPFAHQEENVTKESGEEGTQHINHIEINWKKVWTSTIHHNREIKLSIAFLRPVAFVLLPAVLWTIWIYASSLAAQIILLYAFPTLLLAPPDLFSSNGLGLLNISALIGFLLACVSGGLLSDIIMSKLIIRNNHVFFPEQRLLSLFPAFWVAPVGCIVTAFVCAEKLSWIGIVFGFGMLSFGTVFCPNIAITYVADAFPEYASDCLVVINASKNLVAFLFIYVGLEWVNSSGWIQVYMIMFMATMLGPLVAIPIYYFRHSLERFSQGLTRRFSKSA